MKLEEKAAVGINSLKDTVRHSFVYHWTFCSQYVLWMWPSPNTRMNNQEKKKSKERFSVQYQWYSFFGSFVPFPCTSIVLACSWCVCLLLPHQTSSTHPHATCTHPKLPKSRRNICRKKASTKTPWHTLPFMKSRNLYHESELWKSKAGVLVYKDRGGFKIDLATGQNWYIKGKGPSPPPPPPPPPSPPEKIDRINMTPPPPHGIDFNWTGIDLRGGGAPPPSPPPLWNWYGGTCWEWFWSATKGWSVTIGCCWKIAMS